MADEMKWIRPNISLYKYDKSSRHLITLRNSGNLVADYSKYAECFFNGAEAIIHYLGEEAVANHDIAKLDLWYFSMLYLYRQSLELLLKSKIFSRISKESERRAIVGSVRHDLKQGLDILLASFSESEINKVDDNLTWLSLFFNDISRVDRESDMFRYPFGNSMQLLFSKQTHVSLMATHDNMNRAYLTLSHIHNIESANIRDYDDYEPNLIVEGGHYYQQSVVGYKYHSGAFHPFFTSYVEVGKHFEDLIKNENRTDMFLPMCYTFRNALELGLKMIIFEESRIDQKEALRILRNKKHSLLGLWNHIKDEIAEYADAPEDDTTLFDTQRYIEAFHNFDSVSDIFRYPTDKRLKTYFLNPQIFDMLNIASCFHELCNFLDAVASMLSVIRDYEAEMRHEMGSYDY